MDTQRFEPKDPLIATMNAIVMAVFGREGVQH